MNKFALSLMAGFALLCTGCCLRVGESTRFGLNCCGKKDTETFVAEEKKDEASAVAPQPTPTKSDDITAMVGIGLAVALAGFIGWKAYTQIKNSKKSDSSNQQV